MESLQRLVYFTSYDLSRPGGPNINEAEFAASLIRRFGDRVLIMIPRPAEPLADLSEAEVEFFTTVHERRVLAFLWSSWVTAWRLRACRLKARAPFVVARMGRMPLDLWFLSVVLRQPLVLKSVGRFWFEAPAISAKDRLARLVDGVLCRGVVCRALCVDTVTPQLASAIKLKSGRIGDVNVVPNATCIRRFRPLPRSTATIGESAGKPWPLLGYAGSLPSERGARQLITLAHVLQTRYPKVGVLVVGWDDRMDEVRELAIEFGVEGRCEFVGVVPYEAVPALINRMDIGYSIPARERTAALGTSAQKIRQYLACGVPVISVMSGNEFIETHGLGRTVTPDNLEELVNATEKVLSRLEEEERAFQAHIRRYAEAELSIDDALEHRLALWAADAGRPRQMRVTTESGAGERIGPPR